MIMDLKGDAKESDDHQRAFEQGSAKENPPLDFIG
jgi:hypothetical protein